MQPRITLGEILKEQGEGMRMRLLEGEAGLHRFIDHPRMQKPSLAFDGFLEHLSDYRLQVIGKTELHYLSTKSPEAQKKVVNDLFDLRLAGVVVTRGIEPPEIIRDAARCTDTPLFVSEYSSSKFMTDMLLYLSNRLAPHVWQHGVYLDVFGLGVLLLGDSGIGKSEIGLELISRGHRLIADDMVELVRSAPGVLVGRSPNELRYHMEIRGLGILNIRDLYGAAAITDAKRVRLVIHLIHWEKMVKEPRLQVDEDSYELNGVSLPRIRIPIRPGRSLAVLIEVATRNQLLKMRGIDSQQSFVNRLQQQIDDNAIDNEIGNI